MRAALVSRRPPRHFFGMVPHSAAALLALSLAACAPAFTQQEPQTGLRPPPAYEREYQDYCRSRPGACVGGYGQARDGFMIQRQEQSMETIRRRELEALRLHQLQQQQRR